jgi:hypothetical protein
MNGHKPMTEKQKEMFEDAEHIEVVYSTKYRCKICGYTPENRGCIPSMEKHLKTEHNIEPTEGKFFWMAGYYDSDIKKLLGES